MVRAYELTDHVSFLNSYVRTNIMSTHERDEATATSQEDEFHRILSNADIEMDKTLLRLIQVRHVKA
jgi:hypothetical protein